MVFIRCAFRMVCMTSCFGEANMDLVVEICINVERFVLICSISYRFVFICGCFVDVVYWC